MNIEGITNKAAWAAILSPAWLPSLKDMSEVAGYLLPVLGCSWLIVQGVCRIIETRRRIRSNS